MPKSKKDTKSTKKGKEKSVEKEEKEEEETTKTKIPPGYKEKPELPSVAYLLQHGARDPNEPRDTFLESLVLPGALLLTFVLSLVLFHWYMGGFQGAMTDGGASFKQKFGRKTEF